MELERLLDQYRKIPMQLKLVLLLLATALAVAYSYYENVEAALANVEQAQAEMAELDKQVESLNAAGQNIVAVQSEMRKADEEIAMLLDLLPAEPELERVLGYFAGAAKETGVEMEEFEPGAEGIAPKAPEVALPGVPPAPGAPPGAGGVPAMTAAPSPVDDSVSKMPVRVKISGSYAQITAFFDRVLGLPRVLRLTNFEMINETRPPELATTGGAQAGLPTGARSAQAPEGADLGPPKLNVVANFDAYSQRGMLDQFRKEAEMPIAPPVPVSASAPTDGNVPPPGDPGLSAKPLEGAAP